MLFRSYQNISEHEWTKSYYIVNVKYGTVIDLDSGISPAVKICNLGNLGVQARFFGQYKMSYATRCHGKCYGVVTAGHAAVSLTLTMTFETRNRLGLPIFPNELLLEIISHLNIPPPLPSSSVTVTIVPNPFERREALISLSETCRSLRKFLRPYIWDRIEVRCGMKVGKRELDHRSSKEKKKEFSGEILRQLQVTTVMDPTLAQYVK